MALEKKPYKVSENWEIKNDSQLYNVGISTKFSSFYKSDWIRRKQHWKSLKKQLTTIAKKAKKKEVFQINLYRLLWNHLSKFNIFCFKKSFFSPIDKLLKPHLFQQAAKFTEIWWHMWCLKNNVGQNFVLGKNL